MKWIISAEQDLFTGDAETVTGKLQRQIKKEHPTIKLDFLSGKPKYILEPSREELNGLFKFGSDFQDIIILSSQHPMQYGYAKINLFTVIELRGDYFPFTKEQLELGIPKSFLLQERLGLTIVKTDKKLKDMAGASKLVHDVENMLNLEALGMMSIAGLFLFGVAGGGKSYFAECFAGETGRYYAVLDLPYFMSLPSPTKAVDELFDFLESQKEKYLLLLDEIEKMFDFDGNNLISKQVFGKLLTRLNNIYGRTDNNVTFVATANNITGIMKNSPEFLRKGRFNRLYFLGYPSEDDTVEIFEMYKGKNKRKVKRSIEKLFKKFDSMSDEEFQKERKVVQNMASYHRKVKEGMLTLDEVADYFTLDFNVSRNIRYIESRFKPMKVSDDDRFIYSPPEIQSVSEEMQNAAFLEVLKTNRSDLLKEIRSETGGMSSLVDNDAFTIGVIQDIVPLQVAAAEGISKQISQSKDYTGKGSCNVKLFIEV